MRRKWRFNKYMSRSLFYLLVTSISICLTGCNQIERFDISETAEFYLLYTNGITGCSIENGKLEELTKTKIKVVKTALNPVVHRAELQNRFLVFTEDDWPTRNKEAIVSVDFHDGIIHRVMTNHCAYTSAGSSSEYYYAIRSGTDSSLSVYTPELKETEYIDLESLILSDFSGSGNKIFSIGTDINETIDENEVPRFKTRLVMISEVDNNIQLSLGKELGKHYDRQYWFGDTVLKGNCLFSVSAGYRNLITKERVMNSSIYCYDLQEDAETFFPIEEIAPMDAYDIGDDYLAITHEFAVSQKFGFTLFDYSTCDSKFVDLISENEDEIIVDIKRLDLDTILILTNQRLLEYDLQENRLAFQIACEDGLGTPIHIWTSR